MNPIWFTKDEISYELGIRMIIKVTDIQNIRRLLRRAITRELLLQWDYPTLFRTKYLNFRVTTKVQVLQLWLTRECLKHTEFDLRVDTRVRHLRQTM
jgi:hypothetical protein